jgi:hypothetical protein
MFPWTNAPLGRLCIPDVYAHAKPELAGSYLYGDYGSGEIWGLRHVGTNVTQNTVLLTDAAASISCFGVDPRNNDPLYGALRFGTHSTIQRIDSVNSGPVPSFNGISVSGTNLIISGTNGVYYVLRNSSLSPALSAWPILSTNPFDSNGNFRFTNGLQPGDAREFYMIQLP